MGNSEQLITKNLDIWTSAVRKKSSSGRGANKKIELYGISKLRELILELAVRGFLVPQDPQDEPALELIERYAEEQEQAIKDEKQITAKRLHNFNEVKLPYALPKGWICIELGDLATVERGGSPRPIKSYLTDAKDGLNWIKIGDTDKGGKYIRSTAERIRSDGLKKTRAVYPGDFLLTNSMSFGRPYISLIEGCIHDGWLRINPPKILQKDYLYHLLSSPYACYFFRESAAGAVVQNLNCEKVRLLPILIPPLAEQHRIIAKVDELIALCDQLEQEQKSNLETHETLVSTLLNALTSAAAGASQCADAWQRIKDNFDILFTTESSVDQLKQTILQLAVMGRLVPQDPEDEPAIEILEKIATEKEYLADSKKIKSPKLPPPINQESRPFPIPPSWSWANFAEIIESLKYGTSQKCFEHGDGQPVLRIPNLSNGRLNNHDLKYTKLTDDETKQLALETRDLLIIRSNGSLNIVGRSARVTNAFEGYAYAGYLVRARAFESKFDLNYLHLLFESSLVRKQIEIPIRHGVGLKNINSTEILRLKVSIPPLAEQHRIVAKVVELMALCDQLKANLASAQNTQLNLADSIVEQAIHSPA